MRFWLITVILTLIGVVAASTMTSAQWIAYPTAGVPRLPDGKPKLAAPPPRMPDGRIDFSGMWQAAHLLPCDDVRRICTDFPISAQFTNIGAGLPVGLPYQPWAKELMRQIFLDARPLPPDPNPTWNGYSSARWDGDALVITTMGFRDDQWLDARGSPLTNSATVTERFRRPDFGRLEIELTVNDPKAYTAAWMVKLEQAIVLDTEMLDAACWENEKDIPHLLNAK